jgi:hypothetical protein
MFVVIVIEAGEALHAENTFAQVSSPTYPKEDTLQKVPPNSPDAQGRRRRILTIASGIIRCSI